MRYAVTIFVILWAISAGAWVDTHFGDFLQGSYDAEIYVSRRLELETDPADSGCVEYHARFDVNNDGWYDLISPGKYGPLKVWLGSPAGYSPTNYLEYSIQMGGDCDVSDLNLDGYSELLHSGVYHGYASIYWGTPAGPDPNDVTLLPNDSAEAIYVADLDKDTYLDVAIPGIWSEFYIYWGSAHGYSVADRYETVIGRMPHNMEAADLDKNGYLDPIVLRYHAPNDVVILYQTSSRNFTPHPLYFSNMVSPHGLSIGDFDKNGYTDIVATGYANISFSCVYWGRDTGFDESERLTLSPGQCYGGSAVADFNSDGWLDILYLRSHNQKPKIYYNSGDPPYFSETNTEEIGFPVFATAGVVADFDYDGDFDIFVNHEGSFSYVFYGPDYGSYTSLPVNTDHHGTFREPGQIPSYYSRIAKPCSLGVDSLIIGGTVSWTARTPGSSKTRVYVRVGDTDVPDGSWTNWHEIVTDANQGSLPAEVCERSEYIQYRVDFVWENPAELPSLERIELELMCGDVEMCEPVEPPQMKSQGYWRRQCKQDAHEDICSLIDSVHSLADLFDCFDCDSFCGLLRVDPPENDMCRKARRQFLALLINVASGKLAVCNCLEDGREVGDVVAEIDSILAEPLDHHTCVHVMGLADDLNNGGGIVLCDSVFAPIAPIQVRSFPCAANPNPLRIGTMITYQVSGPQNVRVSVFDKMGRLVRVLVDGEKEPGLHRAEWDGLDSHGKKLPTGVYFAAISTNTESAATPLILIR
jgi:hypothetical protein